LNNFDIKVQRKSIASTYWERRLVELAKFELDIPTEGHWAKVHDSLYKINWVTDIKDPKKVVRLDCGFNPFRTSEEEEDDKDSPDDVEMETDLCMAGGRNVKSASLKVYLYSRQSGHFIKVEIFIVHWTSF
jgi:hypothetical protein